MQNIVWYDKKKKKPSEHPLTMQIVLWSQFHDTVTELSHSESVVNKSHAKSIDVLKLME